MIECIIWRPLESGMPTNPTPSPLWVLTTLIYTEGPDGRTRSVAEVGGRLWLPSPPQLNGACPCSHTQCSWKTSGALPAALTTREDGTWKTETPACFLMWLPLLHWPAAQPVGLSHLSSQESHSFSQRRELVERILKLPCSVCPRDGRHASGEGGSSDFMH